MSKIQLICGDCIEKVAELEENSIDTIITDPPYGLGFMGKEWDHDVPGVPFWESFLRVAKPGAMLLSFGGTRLFHRMACSIEDAGWQIRDCIMWVYGSGFPKSHDISKAIDKFMGEKRIKVQPGNPPSYQRRIGNTRPWMTEQNHLIDSNEAISNEAKLWNGWGTALKPSWEPIIVAIKPLDGTFANNALKYGVSGLNIDEARVGNDIDVGRWPANLIHDGSEEVNKLFPESGSGNNGKPYNYRGKEYNNKKRSLFNGDKPQSNSNYNDNGSAARFFYCAKASRKERNMGCDGLEEKQTWASQEKRESNSFDVFESDGRKKTINQNNHPTVKPIALMEYLCILTKTPTGGIVLDPFMGSGSTGIACIKTKRDFIGIEIDKEYFNIAQCRINSLNNKG